MSRLGLCLLNPHAAGGRAAALAPDLAAALRAHGAPALQLPPDPQQAVALIHALPPGQRVLIAGGDGTVQSLLTALHAGQHELALLPCGTGNDLARALGLARLNWRQILPLAGEQAAQPMDLGQVLCDGNPRGLFASSLTAGFDAAVGAAAHASRLPLPGMLRYVVATLTTLARLAPVEVTVHADGVLLHHGPCLFASSLNTPTYASGMPVAPGARIDDGRLDLVLAGTFSRLGAAVAMPLLLTGLHLHHSRIRLQRFDGLAVQAAAPLPLALDGEPIAAARGFQVRVLRQGLRVVRAMPS